MIDLYYWATPNGHKITIFLEECGLPYKIHPINIMKGEQFQEDFLKIAPNNRIPALVDHTPADQGFPISIFESGAILWYLAEKTKKFIPVDTRGKVRVSEWLYWQMGGLGPMAGQNHHFNLYAPEKIQYAIDRYTKETTRLYGVLDRQLAKEKFVAGNDYTIADMAIYPWIVPWEKQHQDLANFPHLHRWFENLQDRPAIQKAYAIGDKYQVRSEMTEEEKKVLFGQK